MNGEISLVWPDIKNPVTTIRPLRLANGSSEETLRLASCHLAVLVNGCLYAVLEDGHGLRAGDILSRNLDLTRKKRGDTQEPSDQVFVRYKSIFDVRRGIGRVYGRYRVVELPELARWRMDADWLLRTSWTLHRATPETEAQFVWRADRRIEEHVHDQAESKTKALGRFRKILTLTDSTGRRNTGMIPLLCSAADRSIEARAQEIRGIGRRMDWRAVVLEYMIDQLCAECRLIRRAAQDALFAQDIFGDARTPRALRRRANRMIEYARFLGTVQVRTFSRVFAHVSSELEEVGGLMHDAASERSTESLERVRLLLEKIYRSMVLLEQHWKLEEILLVVSDHHHNVEPVSESQIRLFSRELEDVHRTLTNPDPVTNAQIDAGFDTDVLPTVVGGVLSCLTNLRDETGLNLPRLYEDLKTSCKPL